MNTEYAPFDQEKHLGYPPWPRSSRLLAWEKAHGHDVRLKCYPEYGCQAIEMERERLFQRVEELEQTIKCAIRASQRIEYPAMGEQSKWVSPHYRILGAEFRTLMRVVDEEPKDGWPY